MIVKSEKAILVHSFVFFGKIRDLLLINHRST